MTMKALVNICVVGMLTLVATSEGALAQSTATAEARLKELNITLPSVPPPVANYVDAVRVGNLLFLAGNTAAPDWKFKGKVGKDLTVQEGYDTARQVGLIMLAKVRAALGSLDRVKRVVKVLGMVNSADGICVVASSESHRKPMRPARPLALSRPTTRAQRPARQIQ
jgi:enamine deaminase RidA (YjgF/YER057c/UK114 family)